MATVKVRAKVTGTHAVTALYIEAGREYEIEEAIARSATEVFEVVEVPARQTTTKAKEE